MDKVLLVFQKNPELGKVKTRLAVSMGQETALDIYLKLIGHTKTIIDPISAEKQIWYSSWVEHDDNWDLADYNKFTQRGEGLGNRMMHSFDFAFKDPNNKRVIIIGTDCVEITTAIINDAFESLETHDFVIGPANDGGYYLLGMNSYYPNVFEGVEWSTATVCNTTIEKIKSLNKSVHLLPTLSDVDNEEDWNNVKNLIELE
jgi:rSAM/selenodomain-associated transferase 1